MTNNTQRDPSTANNNFGANDRDKQTGQQGNADTQNQKSNKEPQNKTGLYEQGGAADHHGLSSADTHSSES